jgi:uncharacterized damage-inducible protein DinB
MSTDTTALDALRYPIGRFRYGGEADEAARRALIRTIAETPLRLEEAVRGLSADQLETPYRPGGWTLRQVVHHLPDSHMNAYVRFKLALTEEEPLVKPYAEDRWAELADGRRASIETSRTLLLALHERWVMLLDSLAPAAWSRTFRHPEHGARTLDWLLGLYAWHGPHHVAQITSLRQRQGW